MVFHPMLIMIVNWLNINYQYKQAKDLLAVDPAEANTILYYENISKAHAIVNQGGIWLMHFLDMGM